jgi:hypothetical protein
MNSQLTSIVADQQRSDVLAAAARTRRTAEASRSIAAPRASRVWRHLRRRAAVV